MKNKFTHKYLIALMLVVIITITSVYMAGCSDSEQIPTVPATASVATIDEATVNTEVTTQTVTQNNTSEAATSTNTTNVTATTTVENKTEVGNSTQETHEPDEETIVSQGNATPGHSHSYTAKVTKATCGSEGYTTYTCKCGASYVGDYTYALKHNWGGWTTVKEATTEAEGEQESVCTRCGEVKTQKIDKLSSPYDADPRSNPELLRERILYYINEYRDTPATSLPRMTLVADYRAKQIENKFDHDLDDIREAETTLKYGEYTETKESFYNWETGEITYTGNVLKYYCSYGTREAIGRVTYSDTIDKTAYRVATMFYESNGHWSYVGDSNYIYASVGVNLDSNMLYVCVVVGEEGTIEYE